MARSFIFAQPEQPENELIDASLLILGPRSRAIAFQSSFLGRPILWYGFLFAFGFFAAYWILRYLLLSFVSKAESKKVAERFTFYAIVGTIVGARLGDVLFYQSWSRDRPRPALDLQSMGRGAWQAMGAPSGSSSPSTFSTAAITKSILTCACSIWLWSPPPLSRCASARAISSTKKF